MSDESWFQRKTEREPNTERAYARVNDPPGKPRNLKTTVFITECLYSKRRNNEVRTEYQHDQDHPGAITHHGEFAYDNNSAMPQLLSLIPA